MFNSNRDRYHAEYARRHYPVGTKIRLLAMNDPYDPVPPGTIGTVTCVDDAGQLHMDAGACAGRGFVRGAGAPRAC